MYYCGPAVHTLFISCIRMAGDNDFIKSGKVAGWVGDTGILNVYVCISFFFFFLSLFQYSMFMNFNMICLAREMAGGVKRETNLTPSALN